MVKRKRRTSNARLDIKPPANAPPAKDQSDSTQKPSIPWMIFYIIGIIAAGYFVYANNLTNPFVFDDTGNVQRLHDSFLRGNWYPWDFIGGTRRALIIFTLAVNYSISGEAVWSYHLFNNIIHVFAGLALFGVIRRTLLLPKFESRFEKSAATIAFMIALIWTVHPLNTQSVTYIIQRGESLMGLFYLLVMYSAIRLLEKPRNIFWYAVAMVCALLGMMSKEVMATVPLMVIVFDRVMTKWTIVEQIKQRGVLYLVIVVTWSWFPIAGLQEMTGAREGVSAGFGYEGLTPGQYLMTQPVVILQYIKLAIVPTNLSIDYLHKAVHTLFDIEPTPWSEVTKLVILPWFAIILMIGATIYGLFKRHPLAILGAWYFGILSITSTIIPIADLMVEHRTYLSNAAVIALFVFSVHHFLVGKQSSKQGKPIAIVLVAVITMLYSVLTIQRNKEYQSEIMLWQTATESRPLNPRAWHNLGSAYEKEGQIFDDPQIRAAYDENALACWERVLTLTPTFDAAFNGIGQIYLRRGQLDEAEMRIRRAIEIKPDDPEYRYNLGEVFLTRRDWKMAEKQYHKAIAIKSDYAKAFNNLGFALLQQEKVESAIEAFETSIHHDPLVADTFFNLGKALADVGRFEEAIPNLRQCIELDPATAQHHIVLGLTLLRNQNLEAGKQQYLNTVEKFPNDPVVLEQASMILATHPSAEVRNGKRALEFARRSLALTTGKLPFALKAEAAALAELGRFDDAINRLEKMMQILRQTDAPAEIRRPFEDQINQYKRGIPLRIDPNAQE